MKNYKRPLQVGGLVLFFALSNTLKSNYRLIIDTFDTKTEIKSSETSTNASKQNVDLSNYYLANLEITDLIKPTPKLTPEDLTQLIQQELIDTLDSRNEKNILPLIYTTDGLDSFLESMANYKKSKDELAFDNALNKVLMKKNLDSTLIDYYVLKGAAYQESRFDPRARSFNDSENYKKQARGYFQIKEIAWVQFRNDPYLIYIDVTDAQKEKGNVYNPQKNIETGIDIYLYLEDYVNNHHPRADTLTSEDKLNYMHILFNFGTGGVESKEWIEKDMPEESRNHYAYINKFAEQFRKRDALIAYAQEYTQRKKELLAPALENPTLTLLAFQERPLREYEERKTK